MLFKNKIKKRVVKTPGSQALSVSRQIRKRGNGGRIFLKIVNFILALCFFGVAVYLLFFSPFLVISKINISGTENLDPSDVRAEAENIILKKYFNIIPGNNIILAAGGKIEKSLIEKFRRVERADVKKTFPDTLNITVSEKKSALILSSAGKYLILNPEGTAYAEADFEAGDLGENDLTILHDEGNKNIKLSEEILDKSYVRYVLDIKEKLKSDLGIEIEKNFRTPQLVSGDIRVMTAQGWQIYFNKSIPVQKEIEVLGLVMQEKIEKNRIQDLEYVDLRIDNKVYYKFKNSDQPQQGDEDNSEKEDKSEDDKKSKNT